MIFIETSSAPWGGFPDRATLSLVTLTGTPGFSRDGVAARGVLLTERRTLAAAFHTRTVAAWGERSGASLSLRFFPRMKQESLRAQPLACLRVWEPKQHIHSPSTAKCLNVEQHAV